MTGQSRYGRPAEMLDLDVEAHQRLPDPRFLRLERLGPGRVVGSNLDWLVKLHRDAGPGGLLIW